MALTWTSSLCSNIGNAVPARDISSSAAFVSGSPLSCRVPPAKPASKAFTTKCSLSEEDQPASLSVGRRVLARVVATGATLAVFTNMAVAAQGPGNDGPRRTAEKADQLLKAADKLNIQDAPKRFGPGRQLGGADDPTKISQQAGSGALSSAQEGIGDAAKGVSDAAKKVQNKSGGLFGFGKKQSGAVADNSKGALSQAKGKTDEVVRNVRQVVNRDGLGRFRGPAKDIASNVEGAVGQAQNKSSQLTNSAKDAIGQAQSTANMGNPGGNVLSSLQEGLQGLKESVAQTSEDAKNTVEKSLQ